MEPLEFLGLLWSVDHELQVASKRLRARLGVTGVQRVAIRLIGEQPGIGPAELARALHLHPSTLTGILRRLETNGYVHRARDRDDGRRAVLRLTRAGARVEAIREGTIEAAVLEALGGCSSGSVATTAEVLKGLAASLREQRV